MAQRQFIPSLWYRMKTKLHGTNAGVHIYPNGQVLFKKRTSYVTPEADNAGFASWAITKKWKDVKAINVENRQFTIWGEWAGKGVQAGGDAICKIDKKAFFIFAIEILNENGGNDIDSYVVTDPEQILSYVKDIDGLGKDIFILPWVDEAKHVRFFGNVENAIPAQEYANYINDKITLVEEQDDYVFENFGVKGSGEGFVIYPNDSDDYTKLISRELFGTFVFKAKTEAHSSKKSRGVKEKVEIPTSYLDFVDTFLTEARMEQMITEHCNGEYSMKHTPTFLKALIFDIMKESVNEREGAVFEMKMVNKVISGRAVNWLKNKVDMV